MLRKNRMNSCVANQIKWRTFFYRFESIIDLTGTHKLLIQARNKYNHILSGTVEPFISKSKGRYEPSITVPYDVARVNGRGDADKRTDNFFNSNIYS